MLISASTQALWRQLAMLVLAAILHLAPGPARAQPVTTLTNQAASLDVSAASLMWIDADGQANIEQVNGAQRRALFAPSHADVIYALGHHAALWQHYRFARTADSPQDWVLEFPQPLLDRATLYQSSPSGVWTSQTVGDTVAVSSWPEPGRYGQFALRLPDTAVHDVYVRIQNVTSMSMPARVSTRGSQSQRLQVEYLVVGVVFGALLLLIVACATQSRVYRDSAYGWYALYASVLTLVIAAWTGVAGHLLWDHSESWNNLAPGFLGLLAGGAALLVVHHLCGAGARRSWFELAVQVLGGACIPLALAYALLDRRIGVTMIGIYLPSVVIAGLGRAWVTWRRRDIIGLWVLAAFTPMALATLLLVTNIVGFVPTSWLSRYGLMAGLAFEVPLLLIALNLRSRERHRVEARSHALSSQDALTGLLAPHIFQDRLKQILSRAQRSREPAAVVYIDLVNYRYIKATWGPAVAEQSLLRSVIKLRRILRDVDTVGRVAEARFGLILEGVSSRAPITEMASRLIAAGLMPLKGLKPEVILQFHVAAVLLRERLGTDVEITQSLTDLVQRISPRSRRPIRFLEPEMTRPAALQSDFGMSGMPSSDATASAQRQLSGGSAPMPAAQPSGD